MGKKVAKKINAIITVFVDEEKYKDKFGVWRTSDAEILENISAKILLPGMKVFDIEPLNEES